MSTATLVIIIVFRPPAKPGGNYFAHIFPDDRAALLKITVKAAGVLCQHSYGDADWKDLMTSYNGQSITYDTIGNPLTYRDGMTMTWQRGRQLATLQKGSTAVNCVYGEDGLRTKKTANGSATNYHWNDLGQLVEQDGANGTLVFYHDDKGDTGVIVYNGTSYTLRKNAQGDVTAILDIANNNCGQVHL